MTIRNIVSELINKGYDVQYYVRKDGGILVRSINGQKFTGASGNVVARSLVGETLSERREAQLISATKKRMSFAEEYGQSAYKRYKEIATKWRKAQLPKSAGKISMKKFRQIAREKGVKEAMRILSEKEKYASGVAYSKNVIVLAENVRRYAEMTDYGEFEDLADEIEANDGNIKEDAIQPAYNELYRLNTEPLSDELVDEVIAHVKSILGI